MVSEALTAGSEKVLVGPVPDGNPLVRVDVPVSLMVSRSTDQVTVPPAPLGVKTNACVPARRMAGPFTIPGPWSAAAEPNELTAASRTAPSADRRGNVQRE